jgi:hypothetical protein
MRQFRLTELNEFYLVTVLTDAPYLSVWAAVPQTNLVQCVVSESRGTIKGLLACERVHRTSLSRLKDRCWSVPIIIDPIPLEWFEQNCPEALGIVITTSFKRYSPEKQPPSEESIHIDHLKWCDERHQIHADLMEAGFEWFKYRNVGNPKENTHGWNNSFDLYMLDKMTVQVYPVSVKWRFDCKSYSVGGKGRKQLMQTVNNHATK